MALTEIAMRREGGHLVPVDEVSAEEIRLIPTTQDLLVTVKTPRNLRQFRLAWALAQKVSEAVDFLQDRDDAMAWLKIKARHVNMLQNPHTNQVAIIPKSIAFASLGQDAFARIFNRMVYVTCTEIIPGLKDGDLRAELELMVGGDVPTSAPQSPASAPSAPDALGQPDTTASEPAPKPARRPRGPNRPKGDGATAAELAQGRGALGDDPDKPRTPSGKAVADLASCLTAADYVAYATTWIDNASNKLDAQARWNDEYKVRTALAVPSVEWVKLQARIDVRFNT